MLTNDKKRKNFNLLSHCKLFKKDDINNISSSFDEYKQLKAVREEFIEKYNALESTILSLEANKKLLDLFIVLYYIVSNGKNSTKLDPPPEKQWTYYLNVFKEYNKYYEADFFHVDERDYSQLDGQDGDIHLKKIKAGFDSFDFQNDKMETIFGEIYEKSVKAVQDNTQKYTSDFYADKLIQEVFDYKFGPEVIDDLDPADSESEMAVDTDTDATVDTADTAKTDDGIDGKIKKLENIKIFDPACGSGVFLIKAAQKLKKEWEHIEKQYPDHFGSKRPSFSYHDIINKNLFGADKDKHAVEITKFSLNLLVFKDGKKFVNLDANICVQDLLDDDTTLSKLYSRNDYDIVIGNPPWLQTGGFKYKSGSTSKFKIERANLCHEFFMYGLTKWIKHNGYVIMLLPDTTINATFKNALKEYTILSIEYFPIGTVFQNNSCCFLCVYKSCIVNGEINIKSMLESCSIKQEQFIENDLQLSVFVGFNNFLKQKLNSQNETKFCKYYEVHQGIKGIIELKQGEDKFVQGTQMTSFFSIFSE
jgi:hypothetical protein